MSIPFWMPLLIWPRYRSLLVGFQLAALSKKQMARNAVLCVLAVSIALSLYVGGFWSLQKIDELAYFAYIDPAMLWNLVLVAMFALLLATATANSVGAFYTAKDLETIVSSPLRPSSFFWGKYWEVAISSIWFSILVMSPVVLLFGHYYHAGWAFYLVTPTVITLFFLTTVSMSIVLATIISSLLPTKQARFFVVVCGVLLFFTFLSAVFSAGANSVGEGGLDLNRFLEVITLFSALDGAWMPSRWCSLLIGEMLSQGAAESRVSELAGVTFGMWLTTTALAYLVVRYAHMRVLSFVTSNKSASAFGASHSGLVFKFLEKYTSPSFRGIAGKDLAFLFREPSQLVHVLMIFLLCGGYLYLLHLEEVLQLMVGEKNTEAWGNFLVFSNLLIEGFVLTAIATRFVFPSASLEGRNFWVIESSPLNLREFLKTKFKLWLLILLLAVFLVFGLPAAAMFTSWKLLVWTLVGSSAFCIGIVGLGVGLGAYFHEFEWDHPSQLAAGFGSIVFMFAAVGLLFVNGFLMWLMFSAVSGGWAAGIGQLVGSSITLIVIMIIDFCMLKSLLGIRLWNFGTRFVVLGKALRFLCLVVASYALYLSQYAGGLSLLLGIVIASSVGGGLSLSGIIGGCSGFIMMCVPATLALAPTFGVLRCLARRHKSENGTDLSCRFMSGLGLHYQVGLTLAIPAVLLAGPIYPIIPILAVDFCLNAYIASWAMGLGNKALVQRQV